jgi:hypothetical protein
LGSGARESRARRRRCHRKEGACLALHARFLADSHRWSGPVLRHEGPLCSAPTPAVLRITLASWPGPQAPRLAFESFVNSGQKSSHSRGGVDSPSYALRCLALGPRSFAAREVAQAHGATTPVDEEAPSDSGLGAPRSRLRTAKLAREDRPVARARPSSACRWDSLHHAARARIAHESLFDSGQRAAHWRGGTENPPHALCCLPLRRRSVATREVAQAPRCGRSGRRRSTFGFRTGSSALATWNGRGCARLHRKPAVFGARFRQGAAIRRGGLRAGASVCPC